MVEKKIVQTRTEMGISEFTNFEISFLILSLTLSYHLFLGVRDWGSKMEECPSLDPGLAPASVIKG